MMNMSRWLILMVLGGLLLVSSATRTALACPA
jgi:hypothetical protein